MQVVGALLTKYVVANYAKFVKGIDDIAALEVELQETYQKVKEVRSCLRSTNEDMRLSLRVAGDSRAKQQAGDVLDVAEKLLQTRNLQQELK